MANDQCKKDQKGSHLRSTKRAENSPLCDADGRLSSAECGVGTEISEISRPDCTPRWHGERRFWLWCSIHRVRFVSITNDDRKSNGCHCKTAGLWKQPTQYQLSPKSNWRTLQTCWNSQSQNVQILEYVYHDTSQILVTHLQDDWWKDNFLKITLVVNNDTTMHAVHTCTVVFSTQSWSSAVSVLTHTERAHSVNGSGNKIHGIWNVDLGCTQRECKSNVSIIEEFSKMFESRISARATEKWLGRENRTRQQSLGLKIWKVMRRNVWKHIANWRTRRLSNCFQSPLEARPTLTSKRKNWKRLENCQTFALASSWNAFLWYELVDLTFLVCKQTCTSCHKNGPDPVTNACLVWSLTLLTRVITDNIAMWVIRHSIVDWDDSKTQTLLGPWRFEVNFGENSVYLGKLDV